MSKSMKRHHITHTVDDAGVMHVTLTRDRLPKACPGSSYVPHREPIVLQIPVSWDRDADAVHPAALALVVYGALHNLADALMDSDHIASIRALRHMAGRLYERLLPYGSVADLTVDEATDFARHVQGESPDADLSPEPLAIPLDAVVSLPGAVRHVLQQAGVLDLRPFVGMTAQEIDAQPIKGLGPLRSIELAEALAAHVAQGDADAGSADAGSDPNGDASAAGDG